MLKRDESLAQRFEAARPRLQRVALRIVGSPADAEDALQESWLRVGRAEIDHVENLDAWLTTVVARACLDALKHRKSRREEFTPDDPRGAVATNAPGEQPEHEALQSDAIGIALRVLLDELAPAERVAFVLHDMFDVPFDDIAAIVERTPEATRQLASRARRRVRGASVDRDAATQRHDELVRAFFAASRAGNFAALLALLDPSVTARVDAVVAAMPGTAAYWGSDRIERGIEGADEVAKLFLGRARAAQAAYLGDEPAAVWVHDGVKLVLFRFSIAGNRITGIELVGDPEILAACRLERSEG